MTGAPKLAAVRFYVDADVPGPAKVLASVRTDVTYRSAIRYTHSDSTERIRRTWPSAYENRAE